MLKKLILAGLAVAAAAPAWAQDYLPIFASGERVYFAITSTEQGMPPKLTIRVLVAADPPLNGGIVARDILFTVDCTNNTVGGRDARTYDSTFGKPASSPDVMPDMPAGGPTLALRNYVCDGKIPAGATRYNSPKEAYEAAVRILGANRANPNRQ